MWAASSAANAWAAKALGTESVTTAPTCCLTAWSRQAAAADGFALASQVCSVTPSTPSESVRPWIAAWKNGTVKAIGMYITVLPLSWSTPLIAGMSSVDEAPGRYLATAAAAADTPSLPGPDVPATAAFPAELEPPHAASPRQARDSTAAAAVRVRCLDMRVLLGWAWGSDPLRPGAGGRSGGVRGSRSLARSAAGRPAAQEGGDRDCDHQGRAEEDVADPPAVAGELEADDAGLQEVDGDQPADGVEPARDDDGG